MNYLTLPIGEGCPEVVHAIIEVPLGEVNKYEYDRKLHVFRLDRPLYSSVHYPGDYGFIPSTLGGDGDPLDILMLAHHASFPGCLIAVRPVGVLDMLDQGLPDQKVLSVGVNDPHVKNIRNYRDIERSMLREIEHFFSIYKELEGKRTEVIGWRDQRQACELIRECHERFNREGAESTRDIRPSVRPAPRLHATPGSGRRRVQRAR